MTKQELKLLKQTKITATNKKVMISYITPIMKKGEIQIPYIKLGDLYYTIGADLTMGSGKRPYWCVADLEGTMTVCVNSKVMKLYSRTSTNLHKARVGEDFWNLDTWEFEFSQEYPFPDKEMEEIALELCYTTLRSLGDSYRGHILYWNIPIKQRPPLTYKQVLNAFLAYKQFDTKSFIDYCTEQLNSKEEGLE